MDKPKNTNPNKKILPFRDNIKFRKSNNDKSSSLTSIKSLKPKLSISANKCVAPNCNEIAPKNFIHCRLHYNEFSPLYKKYKKTQKPINKYILKSDTDSTIISELPTENLLRIVGIFTKVVKLRKEYQTKAFKPELRYDKGHQHFLEKLSKMISVITKVLENRFNSILTNDSNLEENIDDYSSESLEDKVN